jgi:peptidoglycan/LPS O-acetylase OafA/YrhL
VSEPAVLAQKASPKPRPGFFALELLDNRFPMLHGLRVLGILSVVQFHVTWIFAGEQGIPVNAEYSAASLSVFFGMDLFFILSGFLIGTILLRSLELHGAQNLKRFYVRRIFRTFPSYYVVLAFLALATTLTAAQKSHLPYEIVYLTNFLPLGREHVIMFWGWSLALEEQFYLTVPLLFFVLWKLPSDRSRLTLLFLLWASALATRLFIFYRFGPWTDFTLYGALYFKTYTRFDTLVCGIALAFVHLRHGERVTAFLRDPLHRALLALPALGGLWLLLTPELFGRENVQLFHVFAWGTITTTMYFTSLLLFLSSEGAVSRFLSHPVFRRVATLGYGIYLVHIPILDHGIVPMAKVLDAHKWPMYVIWPISFVALMAASLVVAYALHVLVEKPTLRARERVAG